MTVPTTTGQPVEEREPRAPRAGSVTSARTRARTRLSAMRRRLDPVGLTLAVVMTWYALSPSLLPRHWWMTAASVAASMMYAYPLGIVLHKLYRLLCRVLDLRVRVSDVSRVWLRRLLYLTLAVGTLLAWFGSLGQQDEIARLVNARSHGWQAQLVGLLAGIGIFVVLLLLARGIRWSYHATKRLISPVVPQVLLPVTAGALIIVTLVFVNNQVLYRQFVERALESSMARNAQVLPGRSQPQELERSGSPASYEAWGTLGQMGQAMVHDGPRAEDIERVTGRPAMTPIRVYAGKMQNRSLEATVDAAIRELHRTGAFDRSVLHVLTSTGTGWTQEWTMSAVEYLTGGDSATVSIQYSYFPSGLAYLTDRETPAEAGRTFFEAVYEEWSRLPEDDRPMLVTSGESLGSFAGQSAFDDLEDMLSKVDGAVWSGTPRFTPLWSELTANRRPGSPEVAPVIDNGRHVRFVTRPEELEHDYFGGPYVDWEFPRVVYVQHPSDPVVWWSWDLLWSEPDWMREHVGHDVTTEMAWLPWITFWQLASDMPLSDGVPGGHGHNYHEEMIPVWAAVLGLDPTADYSAIEQAIRENLLPT